MLTKTANNYTATMLIIACFTNNGGRNTCIHICFSGKKFE